MGGRGDVPRDLLRVGRAAVVPDGAIGDHDPGVRGALGQLPDEGGGAGQAGVDVGGAAGAEPGADRVDAERPAPLVGRDPGGFPEVGQRPGGGETVVVRGCRQRDRSEVEEHAVERLREEGRVGIGGQFDQDAGSSALQLACALEPSTAGHARCRISHGDGAACVERTYGAKPGRPASIGSDES